MNYPQNNGRRGEWSDDLANDQTQQLNLNSSRGGNGRYDEYADGYGSSNDGYAPETVYQRESRGPVYRDNGGYQEDYWDSRGDSYGQQPVAREPQKPRGNGLLAGKFDGKKVAINLVIFGLLAAALTFAVVFIVDMLVGMIPNYVAGGVPTALMIGAVAGVVGVLVGLVYIPVSGTGNEKLFGAVIVALALVAVLMWVVLGGLLDGDWSKLVTLTGIICTAVTASATPTRIEAARASAPSGTYNQYGR